MIAGWILRLKNQSNSIRARLSGLRNIILIGGGEMISQVLGAVLLITLARSMTLEGFGEFAYALAAGGLAVALIIGGYPAAITRAIASRGNSTASSSQHVSASIAAVLTIGALSTPLFFFLTSAPVAIMAVALGLGSLHLYVAILRGRQAFGVLSTVNGLGNLLRIAGIAGAALIGVSITSTTATFVYTAGAVLAIVALEVFLRQRGYTGGLACPSWEALRSATRYAAPVLISVSAFAVLSAAPLLLIERYHRIEDAAFFAAARSLQSLILVVPTAIVMVTMPRIARERENARQRDELRSSLALTVVISSVAALTLGLVGRFFLSTMYGPDYRAAYGHLVILCIGAIVLAMRNTVASYWEGTGRTVIISAGTILAAITGTLMMIFLPEYVGVEGVSWGLALAFVPSLGFDLFMLQQLGRSRTAEAPR